MSASFYPLILQHIAAHFSVCLPATVVQPGHVQWSSGPRGRSRAPQGSGWQWSSLQSRRAFSASCQPHWRGSTYRRQHCSYYDDRWEQEHFLFFLNMWCFFGKIHRVGTYVKFIQEPKPQLIGLHAQINKCKISPQCLCVPWKVLAIKSLLL